MMRRSAPQALATGAFALATGALALAAGACGAGAATGDADGVGVVAAFYPLQFVAERVGGDAVAVTNLTKPGAEPHDLELSPVQVGQVSDADLVIYLKGFQPAVDDAVEQVGGDRAVDAAAAVTPLPAGAGAHPPHTGDAGPEREEAGGRDPHLWLDPTRLATVADAVAARLVKADPDGAAGYRARAAALRTDLGGLDREYADGLRTCQRREMVVSHTAFGYLADRYDLEQVGLTGLSPEDEPSPRRLAEVTAEARRHGATTIFFETLVSPKVAETIARAVGADTAVLDPLEGLQPGRPGDYLSIMRTNLATLRSALGCS
jgi:zinc transport system substrate-binding protein